MNQHDKALEILSGHIGRGNGITAQALAGALQVQPRQVRTIVSELREEGIAVCGRPATGYYIAATPFDLEETCKFLRGRALHSLRLEAQMRKISLPDLIGQLHLKT